MEKLSDVLSVVDVYCEGKKEGMGEDYFSYSYPKEFQNNNAFIAVFDGCGGIGAKRFEIDTEIYTGAYLASRACAYKTLEYYKKNGSFNFDKMDSVNLEIEYVQALNEISSKCSTRGSELKGRLASKNFPTTASIISVKYENGMLYSEFLWAGDSRGYILDSEGLKQITIDDLDDEQDAMSNILNDASLSNLINSDEEFKIHTILKSHDRPVLFISATDGCFGYFTTPMHFEYVILHSICESDSINEFERNLSGIIREFTADDFTFGIIAAGFESFNSMKSYFKDREKYIYKNYIKVLEETNTNEVREKLWDEYKKSYYLD